MMRRSRLVLAVVLPLASLAHADTEAAPYAAMRTLQVLQEQVAHGNTTAQTAQPQLMAHIAEGFLAADPAVWSDMRNARAAVLFLLSGGRPSVIRSILEHTNFPTAIDRLLKGALAYGEGQDEVARQLLAGIDPQTLPTALGAHVALVQAILCDEQDAARAIKLLDLARLLAPGTLIEEAALRREVFLLINKGTSDKALLLSRQYFRRYRTSSYADNFRQRFADAAIRMAVAGDTKQLSALDTVLNELPPDETRAFYLLVARTALIDGKSLGARFAANKALNLATKGSREETQAKLYLAASQVVSEDPSDGLFALAALDASHLDPEDGEVRDAAIAVGTAIRAAGPTQSAAGDTQDGRPDSLQATFDRAHAALDEGTRLLQASQP